MNKLFLYSSLSCLAVFLFLGSRAYSQQQEETLGRVVYSVYCSVCHGQEGRGDGPSAAAMIPKPVDFTDPATNSLFTREKIMDVVVNGKPLTQMEGWKERLSNDELIAVSEYILSLK